MLTAGLLQTSFLPNLAPAQLILIRISPALYLRLRCLLLAVSSLIRAEVRRGVVDVLAADAGAPAAVGSSGTVGPPWEFWRMCVTTAGINAW